MASGGQQGLGNDQKTTPTPPTKEAEEKTSTPTEPTTMTPEAEPKPSPDSAPKAAEPGKSDGTSEAKDKEPIPPDNEKDSDKKMDEAPSANTGLKRKTPEVVAQMPTKVAKAKSISGDSTTASEASKVKAKAKGKP